MAAAGATTPAPGSLPETVVPSPADRRRHPLHRGLRALTAAALCLSAVWLGLYLLVSPGPLTRACDTYYGRLAHLDRAITGARTNDAASYFAGLRERADGEGYDCNFTGGDGYGQSILAAAAVVTLGLGVTLWRGGRDAGALLTDQGVPATALRAHRVSGALALSGVALILSGMGILILGHQIVAVVILFGIGSRLVWAGHRQVRFAGWAA